MKQKEILIILRELSLGYLNKEINGKLYARVCESLIVLNLDLIPKMEDFADFLAQYSPNNDLSELYNDQDLKKKIKEIFKLKYLEK